MQKNHARVSCVELWHVEVTRHLINFICFSMPNSHGQTIHRGKDANIILPEIREDMDHAEKLQTMHRRMQIQLQVLPTRAKIALGVALILSLVTYGYIFHYFFLYNHVSDRGYLETHKCPACYGHSLCNQLQYGMGKYTGYSKLQFLNSLANIKNVNFGRFGGTEVVFKKLAHDSELHDFDEEMCSKAKMGSGCNVGDAMSKFISGSRIVTVEEVKGISDLTKCPSQRLVDQIVDKYKEKADAIDMSFPEKLGLITTLKINPEPLMLQVMCIMYT